MTEPKTAPLVLELLGDPSAEVCEGEFCVIPPHHDTHVVNGRLDSDRV
ncbi:MAG: hypothetical protein ABI435_05035 [Pseudolysinimonas sp.]